MKPCKIYFNPGPGGTPTFVGVVSSAVDNTTTGDLINTLSDGSTQNAGQVLPFYALVAVDGNTDAGNLPLLNTIPLVLVSERGGFSISGGNILRMPATTSFYKITYTFNMNYLASSGTDFIRIEAAQPVAPTYSFVSLCFNYIALATNLNPTGITTSGTFKPESADLQFSYGSTVGSLLRINSGSVDPHISNILIEQII